MTLFRQIGLAILFIITTILSGVMIINYNSTKQNMIESLYETTANNISTLSDKLSKSENDKATISSIIDSEFDNGYFKKIEFLSNDDDTNYCQIDNEPIEDVPEWFINFTNIKLKSVSADVSSGWDIIGVVSVEGDVSIVYKALYKLFLNLIYIFIISLVVSLIMISIMLYFILKPLYIIQHQADSILKHKFVINKNLPHTTEFKDVAIGMNMMVKKVEEIFQKGNEAVQKNKELLYNDHITKLFNRRYLMVKLPNLIKLENKTAGGTIIFIALSGVEILNQILGHEKVNEIFLSLANIFKLTSNNYQDNIIARVNGTEFSIVLADCDIESGVNIAKEIDKRFHNLLKQNQLNDIEVLINFGVYKYNQNVTISEIMTRTDNALSKAKADHKKNIYQFQDTTHQHDIGKEQWRTILENVIENRSFSLNFNIVQNKKENILKYKVMKFIIKSFDDKRYLCNDFIAPAINLRLVSKLYIMVIKHLMTTDNKDIKNLTCSIKLPNEFIKDPNSFKELSSLFKQYANNIKFNLAFEITDSFAIHNTVIVKSYSELFAKYNFELGINSFTSDSDDFDYLKDLNPKFLKAEANFLLDQTQNSIDAIKLITSSLDITIIATDVKLDSEIEQLEAIGIVNIQGEC